VPQEDNIRVRTKAAQGEKTHAAKRHQRLKAVRVQTTLEGGIRHRLDGDNAESGNEPEPNGVRLDL
jgi:hypothetical protein